MNKPDEPAAHKAHKEESRPKPSRLEEALLAIEEYADDLREMIKKLRQRLH